jgi:hypothetical protein
LQNKLEFSFTSSVIYCFTFYIYPFDTIGDQDQQCPTCFPFSPSFGIASAKKSVNGVSQVRKHSGSISLIVDAFALKEALVLNESENKARPVRD